MHIGGMDLDALHFFAADVNNFNPVTDADGTLDSRHPRHPAARQGQPDGDRAPVDPGLSVA